MTSTFTLRHLTSCLLALGLTALAASAHAGPWTSMGSGGTPDESTLASPLAAGKISQSAQAVSLLTGSAASTATVRYNVTAVFNQPYAFVPVLEARFIDSGTTTRVLATLKAYNTSTGLTRTLTTLDSNSFAASKAYQTQSACNPSGGVINDFGKDVYWVEVDLSRTDGSTGTAALAGLRIDECVW
jgi:hypothetical protein